MKRLLATVGLGVSVLVTPFAGPALATTEASTSIQQATADQSSESNEVLAVWLRQESTDETTKKVVRAPIADVEFEALLNDQSVGKGKTDQDGKVEIPLPGPGEYTVLLDETTLPEGVTIKDELKKFVLDVRPNERQILNPVIGRGAITKASKLSELPQRLVNGLKFGLVVAISSVGLSLIFGTTGLSNFAHGEMVTFGGIVAWLLNSNAHIDLIIAIPIAIAAGGAFGGAMELGIWKPLRKRGTGLIAMLVISIGLGLFLRYLFQYIFGERSKAFHQWAVQRAHDFGPFSLTPRDLIAMIVSFVVLILVALMLQRTKLGKAMRAVSDNKDLASSSGIDVDRVILYVWVMGGALAALGGIILGLDEQVFWERGSNMLLIMFAAITLGGLGSAYGALVGSFVVGIMIETSTLIIPNELKNVGALAVLILVLLVRPQGILGRKERVG